ncbi:hypothetical protein [Polyangium aurulentum]|uniref:hypothetical protein n=1 Tax=Polyangium aurulentum TaxID=2567896 RepID=UPI0010ADF53F|nr:hypothetical protein [Polyangium aurulentum]UQA61841.1 hypothetical protein E8A73_015760 [Polyangium aurulentum]
MRFPARSARSHPIEKGIEQGIEKGIAPLVHLFERRLARALAEPEIATLIRRVREDGPDRVGDAALDLSPEDLASWLAAKDGH